MLMHQILVNAFQLIKSVKIVSCVDNFKSEYRSRHLIATIKRICGAFSDFTAALRHPITVINTHHIRSILGVRNYYHMCENNIWVELFLCDIFSTQPWAHYAHFRRELNE